MTHGAKRFRTGSIQTSPRSALGPKPPWPSLLLELTFWARVKRPAQDGSLQGLENWGEGAGRAKVGSRRATDPTAHRGLSGATPTPGAGSTWAEPFPSPREAPSLWSPDCWKRLAEAGSLRLQHCPSSLPSSPVQRVGRQRVSPPFSSKWPPPVWAGTEAPSTPSYWTLRTWEGKLRGLRAKESLQAAAQCPASGPPLSGTPQPGSPRTCHRLSSGMLLLMELVSGHHTNTQVQGQTLWNTQGQCVRFSTI